jgi:A/G-specific adenine glycosylase
MATNILPQHDLNTMMPRYTQGMMDLGASLCSAKKPRCEICPLKAACCAKAQANPEKFPVKTRKLKRSAQTIWLLWAQTEDGALWLSQRPTPGVWAGLYCFALFDERAALQAALPTSQHANLADAPAFKHVLTHKDLYLHPVRIVLPSVCMPTIEGAWVAADRWPTLGLPAPIKKLLTL